MAIMNAGGIKSKQMSISNIVNKFDIRALIVSETHLSGKEKPFINDNIIVQGFPDPSPNDVILAQIIKASKS